MVASPKYIQSSRTSPCPGCGRTKDGDCRWNAEVVLCHTYIHQNAEISGYVYQGATKDGMWGQYFPIEQKQTRPKNRKDYYYPDRDGNPLIKVTRVDEGNGHKQFYQSHWDGKQWINGCPKEIRHLIPIYRYQEVKHAIALGQPIFMVEGEGVADDLWDLGIAATTTIGGSKKYRSYGNYTQDLDSAKLVLAPDRDRVGVEHMEEIAKDFPDAQWCYVFPDLPFFWDNLQNNQGLDASDWIADGATKEQIMAAVGQKRQQILSERSFNIISHPTAKRETLTSVQLEQILDELIAQGLPQSQLAARIPELAKKTNLVSRDVWQLYKAKLSEVEQQELREDTASEIDLLLDAMSSKLDTSKILPAAVVKPISKLASWLNLRSEAYLTALLTAVSTLHKVGTKLIIHEGMGFEVTPNLFAALVAESSQKKSPILKEMVTKPLRILQKRAKDEYQAAMDDYNTKLLEWEQLPKEQKVQNPAPEKPKLKIYYFNNANGEGIRDQLQTCPQQGLLALVDELAGLIKSANAYRNGRGSDEEDLLSYYDGHGNVTLRANGLRCDVDEALIGIIGTIQPDVLQSFMKDCSDGNGKWARFMFVNLPLAASEMPPEVGTLKFTEMLVDLYEKVDNLPPTVYRLSKDAFAYYRQVYNKLEQKRVSDPHQGMRTVWGKTEGRIGKIAINLHVIKALLMGETPSPFISQETVVAAAHLANFYAVQVQSLHINFASESIAPHLAKVVELSKRHGGWIKPKVVQLAISPKKRPSPDTVRSWFKELVEMGKGETKGTGRSIEFNAITPPGNLPPGQPPPDPTGNPPKEPLPLVDAVDRASTNSSTAETHSDIGGQPKVDEVEKVDCSAPPIQQVDAVDKGSTNLSTAENPSQNGIHQKVDFVDGVDLFATSTAFHQEQSLDEYYQPDILEDLSTGSTFLPNGLNLELARVTAVDGVESTKSTKSTNQGNDAKVNSVEAQTMARLQLEQCPCQPPLTLILRPGDKAVSTTTGEELVVTELFSVNGFQMAKIKYLRDGAEGTSRIEFLSPAPSS